MSAERFCHVFEKKFRQTDDHRKIPSNQRRWSPVNVTESWSHCLKHGTTIEKEKLRQIEAKEKGKNYVKPNQRKRKIPSNHRWSPVNVTESWSHCLKHRNDNRTSKKNFVMPDDFATFSKKKNYVMPDDFATISRKKNYVKLIHVRPPYNATNLIADIFPCWRT